MLKRFSCCKLYPVESNHYNMEDLKTTRSNVRWTQTLDPNGSMRFSRGIDPAQLGWNPICWYHECEGTNPSSIPDLRSSPSIRPTLLFGGRRIGSSLLSQTGKKEEEEGVELANMQDDPDADGSLTLSLSCFLNQPPSMHIWRGYKNAFFGSWERKKKHNVYSERGLLLCLVIHP